ncbi:MAG: GNAT family N-acetyltransferase [Cytophagaceae bacterium]
MDVEIMHCEEEKKFFIKINGVECCVKYIKWNDKVWDFIGTFVPNNFKDAQKLAMSLVKQALDFANSQNVKIRASCRWVQDFLIDNKEYRSLIYYPY